MKQEQGTATSWTTEEDQQLRTCLEEAGGKVSWSEVARRAFPEGEHDKVDCTERWRILSKPKALRGPWTKEEDAKLQSLVDIHGSEKWVVIAADMGSRSGKQCRERWHNHLDPTINKGEWTAEEEQLIHRMYAKIGSRWAEMAKHLPGRPDNAIKNFFNASLIRQKRKRGDSISSMTGALDLGAGEMSSAPSMVRSASSNSLSGSISSPRFTPYVRSSPMTKSRSESISSLTAFSPLRGASIEQFPSNSPGGFPAPYYPPAVSTGMTRSQSSMSSYSPRTAQGGAPVQLMAVSRDITKGMQEPSAIYTAVDEQGYPVQTVPMRDTPPATPDRAPFRHHQHSASSPAIPAGFSSAAGFPQPPSPPMTAATNAFYTGTGLHPEYEAGPTWSGDELSGYADPATLGGYEQSFSHLHIADQHLGYSQDQYAAEQQFTYPDPLPDLYSPPLSGHVQSASEPMYHTASYDAHALGHSASYESIQPNAIYGGNGSQAQPFIHPSHLVSVEQAQHYDFAQAQAQGQVDEWGNVLAPSPSAPGLSHSYSSHSLNHSPIDGPSPGSSDFYNHATRSSTSSAASSPYHQPYSPTVEDVPEEGASRLEPRKPPMPRRGSMPAYPASYTSTSTNGGGSSIYVAAQQPQHHPSYTSTPSLAELGAGGSPGTLSHSLSTPASLSSSHGPSSSLGSKPSKPPLSSSHSYHSTPGRRISRPSSLSLSSTLEPPIDLTTPLASPSIYRPSMAELQQQATPRASAAAGGSGMARGFSSPGQGGLQGGLRIQTAFGGGGGGGGGAGMARSATFGGAGAMGSSSWAGSRVGGGSGSGKGAHPTSDLMGVDQHGRACLPGIAG